MQNTAVIGLMNYIEGC